MAFSSNIVTINRLKTAFSTLRDNVIGKPSGTGVSGTTLSDQVKTLNGNKITKSNLLDYVYPVGAIYMSTSATSPATFLGGTWQRISGRFLLAADDSTYKAGGTGGEATHTLTTAEMPSHSHTVNSHSHSIGDIGGSTSTDGVHNHNSTIYGMYNSNASAPASKMGSYPTWVNADKEPNWGTSLTDKKGNHAHTVSNSATNTGASSPGTSSAGSSSAHNNMPPYLVVYVWKRTA